MALIVNKYLMWSRMGTFADFLNSNGTLIHLFQNDYVPTPESVIADFTFADFDGYTPQEVVAWELADPYWVPPHVVLTHYTVAWEASGVDTNTIYGYLVTNDAVDEVFWAERRETGGVVFGGIVGQYYQVFPKYTRRSEYPI